MGWLALALLLGVILVAITVGCFRYPDQPGPLRSAMATVEIPPGTGLVGIKGRLVRAGVIRDDPRFILFAKFTGVSRSLQAGEYAFPPGVTPRAVLRDLAAGTIVPHALTLPEGLTLEQAADIIQAGGWGGREEFLRLVADPALIKGFGLDPRPQPAGTEQSLPTLEGYLFPDTYLFAKGTGLRPIVSAMVQRMLRVLAEEDNRGPSPEGEKDVPPGAGPPGGQDGAPHLSRHQVLILASIIEKETALASERPLVAKVFLNRLRSGMKLQADPTVIFGLSKFGSPLTKDDLKRPNPYNTYLSPGLPSGPICSPGRSAIAAVLHPAGDDYYYFVSQNDGSHYFSKTLAEHNQAVVRYRKKRLSNKE